MKANYGIDAPTVVTYLLLGGGGSLAISFVPGVPDLLVVALRWMGAAWFLTGIVMMLGSKVFKLLLRNRLLDSLHLKGDERALDMGCGRGLMLIGLAKRLPNGKAVGVDLWDKSDQSGNAQEATWKNARSEKVDDRIEIETADMRTTPFKPESFDSVVSSWAIHNIPDQEGRWAAVLEAVRVLKPGGQLLIVDIFAAKEYAKLLEELGMQSVSLSGPNFMFIVPSRVVRAIKPIKASVDKNMTLS